MSIASVRTLLKTTLEDGVTRLQSAGTDTDPSRVAAHPVWTFNGLSPVAAIVHEDSDIHEDARRLYSNHHTFSVRLYVLADIEASGVATIEAAAESIMDELVADAIPALRAADFELVKLDGTPKNAPWAKLGGLRYRAKELLVRFEEPQGDF